MKYFFLGIESGAGNISKMPLAQHVIRTGVLGHIRSPSLTPKEAGGDNGEKTKKDFNEHSCAGKQTLLRICRQSIFWELTSFRFK